MKFSHIKKMILSFGFLIVSGVLHNIALCDDLNNAATELPGVTMTTPSQNTVPVSTVTSTNTEPSEPATEPTVASVKINNMNIFTSNLNKYIFSSNEKDNPASVMWSPMSVFATLRALYQGADGSTLEELKNILSIKNDNEPLANSALVSPNSLLKSFTGLFIAEDASLNPSYEERVVSSNTNKDLGMSTKIQPIDFKQNVIKSAKYINEIIKNKTDGQIDRIVDPATLSSDTKMIIVNAVEFKGKWRNPFDAKGTKSDTFNGLRDATTVNMMSQIGTFESGEIKELNATVLQMDYADSSFVCQFILPEPNTSVQSVWKAINEKGVIDELSNYMEPKEMKVLIPKMRLESDVPVQDALTKMGLATLFIPQANLSRMLLPTESGRNEVYVSKMMHKTVFEMDEEGTKAAAVTMGVLIPLSNFNTQPDEFLLNRPFVIILRDIKTNSIVFMGCVTEMTPGDMNFSESDRANIIPSPENQIKDPSTENSKITEEGSESNQSTTATSATEEEWWKHTGAPEYLTLPENSVQPSNTTMKLVTPRFQQPEPLHPSGIKFPYPHISEYKINGSAMKKSKEKNKSRSPV